MPPHGRLSYLYVGTEDTERDLAWYVDVMGAEKVWSFDAFGAKVAAVRLWGEGPLLLLADHRPKGSVLPVYAVRSLDEEERRLRPKGWEPAGPRFGIPDGDCYLFHDPSGNELAMYEDTRPRALEREDA